MMDISAYKRLQTNVVYWFFPVAMSIVCGFWWYSMPEKEFQVFAICMWLIALGAILDKLCTADDYEKLLYDNTRIYVYNLSGKDKNKCEIIILSPRTIRSIKVNQDCYDIKRWKKTTALLFKPDNDCDWYYFSPEKGELRLGKRLLPTLFLCECSEGKIQIKLSALHEDGIKYINAERVIYKKENIYVPSLGTPKPSSEYFITVSNGEYKLYVVLDDERSNTPLCLGIYADSIIFQDCDDRVILVKNGNNYEEICRKRSITRRVNDVIVELTEDYRIGGVVWQYIESTKTLKKLYEGIFLAIGFDKGDVVGAGWEYNPDSGENQTHLHRYS